MTYTKINVAILIWVVIITTIDIFYFNFLQGKRKMLNQAITTKLNEQINLEFFSSNTYLQMSAWCSNKGYEGAAAFFLRHADEEMEHMQKLFDYVSETGGLPLLGKIEAPRTEYATLREVLEVAFEHEKHVTAKINELVEVTFANKDYSTFNFLQWYVAEQHEEETLFGGVIDKFDILGNDGKAIYLIDKELLTLE